jgi:N-acetyl-gamma-glutamyl-phosphate reductase
MSFTDKKVRVAIIGAGGYGGVGAIELLLRHPRAEVVRAVSLTDVGKRVSDVYPHLCGFCDLMITGLDDPTVHEDVDIAFFSTPDGVGQKNAGAFLQRGIRVIDYSGDFRFPDPAAYAEYASRIGKPTEHAAPGLLAESVYGIPELNRDAIRNARLVGNPGCFAIACILGLAPAVATGVIDRSSIICDCKSGVSGAGKKPSAGYHYPARYDNVNAYKVAGHQHVHEIERTLSGLAGSDIHVTFTPHVLPMTRGILATIYARLNGSLDDLIAAYRARYADEPFVRVLPPASAPSIADVRGSNYCNIWLNADPRTGQAIIVSHIDNLMKGQAANAVQNMNLMMGLEESLGLDLPGQYP